MTASIIMILLKMWNPTPESTTVAARAIGLAVEARTIEAPAEDEATPDAPAPVVIGLTRGSEAL